MTEALAKRTKTDPHVIGPRPIHVHRCPEGDHEWKCNSPYCNYLNIECPEHGGPRPIIEGYEPWRGR